MRVPLFWISYPPAPEVGTSQVIRFVRSNGYYAARLVRRLIRAGRPQARAGVFGWLVALIASTKLIFVHARKPSQVESKSSGERDRKEVNLSGTISTSFTRPATH